MPINIHGKQYVTVSERVQAAHEEQAFEKLETEVLTHEPLVVIKATVTIKGKTFTGISAANPSKSIEKMSPYEVAETSAVGRALGFAGFGIVDGIASADEMSKAGQVGPRPEQDPEWIAGEQVEKVDSKLSCKVCGAMTEFKQGVSKSGKPYKGYFCTENRDHPVTWIH